MFVFYISYKGLYVWYVFFVFFFRKVETATKWDKHLVDAPVWCLSTWNQSHIESQLWVFWGTKKQSSFTETGREGSDMSQVFVLTPAYSR